MSDENIPSETLVTNDIVDPDGVHERSVDTKKNVSISEVEKIYAMFFKKKKEVAT